MLNNIMPHPTVGGIKQYRDPSVCPSVCLSHGACSFLGYRHAGCLQLCHCRPPEMCGLRTRPRKDVDSPWFLPPRTAIGGGISSRLLRVIPCYRCINTQVTGRPTVKYWRPIFDLPCKDYRYVTLRIKYHRLIGLPTDIITQTQYVTKQ